MDHRIASMHQSIFNRNIVPWPPLTAPYIPDPVKWNRLNQIQKQQHITKANNVIDYIAENPSISQKLYNKIYTSRPDFYNNIIIPPGFESVQDVLGAISRDRFA